MRAVRCIVCGLETTSVAPAEPALLLCGATCVAEAEREIPLAVGRMHALEQLQERTAGTPAWQAVLRPALHREADRAPIELAELRVRVQLLERAIATWHAARAQRRGHPVGLAPRSFSTRAVPTPSDPAASP